MDIPTYLSSDNYAEQQTFMQEMFQTLLDGLSDNGWTVPQATTAFIASIAPNMPDGTIWYDTAHIPPCFVGKINGVLVQFVTAAYP